MRFASLSFVPLSASAAFPVGLTSNASSVVVTVRVCHTTSSYDPTLNVL